MANAESGGLPIAIIALLPRLTKSFPTSLAVILVATVCAVGISATVGDCGTAGGKTARAGSAVGDTLIGRTQAAAVVYIVRKKQHQHLKINCSVPNALGKLAEMISVIDGVSDTLPVEFC